jgi:hypothetical protein
MSIRARGLWPRPTRFRNQAWMSWRGSSVCSPSRGGREARTIAAKHVPRTPILRTLQILNTASAPGSSNSQTPSTARLHRPGKGGHRHRHHADPSHGASQRGNTEGESCMRSAPHRRTVHSGCPFHPRLGLTPPRAEAPGSRRGAPLYAPAPSAALRSSSSVRLANATAHGRSSCATPRITPRRP